MIMGMKLVEYFCGVLVLASIGLAILEIIAYRRRLQDKFLKAFARSRLRRRILGIVLLLAAIGFIIAGEIIRARVILYLSLSLICVLGIFIIVLVDLRQTAKEIISQHKQVISGSIEGLKKESKSGKEE